MVVITSKCYLISRHSHKHAQAKISVGQWCKINQATSYTLQNILFYNVSRKADVDS